MNFDTKHLVRWGIPGWILIIAIGPFIFFNYQNEIVSIIDTVHLLAIGAFLTIIGVPLGYLLNQIHHALFWVLFNKQYKDNREYFRHEILIDTLFMQGEKGKFMHERYRYLLSRKHELGGLTVSLGLSSLIILVIKINESVNKTWSWVYFLIIFILFLLIWKSRDYSSENLDEYFDYYIEQSKNIPEEKEDKG